MRLWGHLPVSLLRMPVQVRQPRDIVLSTHPHQAVDDSSAYSRWV
jgi:hypothetical protein